MEIATTCDLHTHSFYSDGTFSPSELIAIAERVNIGAVALCDHNTVRGLDEFSKRAKNSPVKAVPGIEITAGHHGHEVHMLGLFIRPDTHNKITDFVQEINRRKQQSISDMYGRFRNAGYAFEYDEVLSLAKGATPNRAHFAEVLKAHGYIATFEQGFEHLLKEGCGFYVAAQRLDAFDIIDFIVSVNAVPVLAHPLLNFEYDELKSFLLSAKTHGLAGMETDYTTFTLDERRAMQDLAQDMGLLKSGASDFHGERKKGVYMGIGKGDLAVPIEYYKKLKSYSDTLCP